MVGLAGALVLNIGTLSARWVEAMLLAGRAANARGDPGRARSGRRRRDGYRTDDGAADPRRGRGRRAARQPGRGGDARRRRGGGARRRVDGRRRRAGRARARGGAAARRRRVGHRRGRPCLRRRARRRDRERPSAARGGDGNRLHVDARSPAASSPSSRRIRSTPPPRRSSRSRSPREDAARGAEGPGHVPRRSSTTRSRRSTPTRSTGGRGWRESARDRRGPRRRAPCGRGGRDGRPAPRQGRDGRGGGARAGDSARSRRSSSSTTTSKPHSRSARTACISGSPTPAPRRRGLADSSLGRSVTTFDEAVAADADYLGAGPVWETPSKADAAPPLGLAGARADLRGRLGARRRDRRRRCRRTPARASGPAPPALRSYGPRRIPPSARGR